jgi:hypothetical protein
MPKTRTVTPTESDELEPASALEAAAAEVAAETDDTVVADVQFRGETFPIPVSTFASARFLFALATDVPHRILFEALGAALADKFIRTLKPGEGIYEVTKEFFDAVNDAAGQGNS